MIYDPSDPSAVTVANHYQQVRGISERNMVPYVFPQGSSFQFPSRTSAWDFVSYLRTELNTRGLTDQLQAIVLIGVVPKLSAQSVANFNNGNAFAITSLLYLSPNYSQASFPVSNWDDWNRAYASEEAFSGPAPTGTRALTATTVLDGQSYWPSMLLLGYTGRGGLRVDEWFTIIDRAKARDGTHPDGTIYWPLNSDVRSRTREVEIAAVAPIWQARGIRYQVTGTELSGFERWVQNRNDIAGGIVGQRNPTTPAGIHGGNTFLGGWVDQLTSNGGNIEWFVSQDTQMLAPKWLRAGADGASGSGYEPYAYREKFAHAHIHTHLRAGASQVEAFWQSIVVPSEIIPFGDPLLQPWAHQPQVTLIAPAAGATVNGTIAITATALVGGGKTLEQELALVVDGRRVLCGQCTESVIATATKSGFALDTKSLSDGWHELRVIAYNADSVRSEGEARVAITVNNAGQALALQGPKTYDPDSSTLNFMATVSGPLALNALTLQANGRNLGSFPVAGGTLAVTPEQLRSFAPLRGDWTLYAVGTRADGTLIRSSPFTTTAVWPAMPAIVKPMLGPHAADVHFFERTTAPDFSWDRTAPTLVTTIPGDTELGVALSIDAVANDADASIDTITLGGRTLTLSYAQKPGFQVDFQFYAPTDDWYEFAHDFSERVFYSTRNQSEQRACFVDGILLTDREGVLPPRHLAAGWHTVRMRFAVTAGSRFGKKISDGPSPQGWMSWKARVRGGPHVDFQIIPPALCANQPASAGAAVPMLNPMQPPQTVTGTTCTLTAATQGADGILTYHWTRLAGGTHAGFHTGLAFKPSQEPQTVQFSTNGSTAAATTTITFNEPGDYLFGLRVAGPEASAYTTVPVRIEATPQTGLFITDGTTPLQPQDTPTLTKGSPVVRIARTAGLEVGQRVVGKGIPDGTTIVALEVDSNLTLSQAVTADGDSLSYLPLTQVVADSFATVTACTVDQFARRIPVASTTPGQPTLTWTSSDSSALLVPLTADGEQVQFRTLPSSELSERLVTIRATGVNGRTGTNAINLKLRPNRAPTVSGADLIDISQDEQTKMLIFTAAVADEETDAKLSRDALLRYAWSVVSTPPDSPLHLESHTSRTISAKVPGPGRYDLELLVTDRSGARLRETRHFTILANGLAEWVEHLDALPEQTVHAGEHVLWYQPALATKSPREASVQQWQTSTDAGRSWQECVGKVWDSSDEALMAFGPLTAADDGRLYRLQISNSAGTATTTPGKVHVLDPPTGYLEITESAAAGSSREVREGSGVLSFTVRRRGRTTGPAAVSWHLLDFLGTTLGVDVLSVTNQSHISRNVQAAA